MALVANISVGRLLSRNERLTTAKFNAVVKSIVINISGSVGNTDLVAGAVTPDKLTQGAYFYASPAVFDGNQTYTAAFSPVITSYVDGLILAVKVDTTNPKAAYLNAGAGSYPIYKHGGRRTLDPGDLVANGILQVRFNTTLNGGCWEMLSLPGRPVETTPFIGATAYLAGQAGVLPEAKAGQQNYYLRGDGNWVDVVTQIQSTLTQQFLQSNTNVEIFKAQNLY